MKWVSIRKLKEHEFLQTLRHIRSAGENWHATYTRLGELLSKLTHNIIKQASSLVAFYLLLSTFGNDSLVSITIKNITASIPAGYITVTASLVLFIVVQNLQILLMLIFIRSREGLRIRMRGFSANSYGFYFDQDEMALVTPISQNIFMQPTIPIPRLLTSLVMLVYLSALFPILGMWFFLFLTQIDIVKSVELSELQFYAASFGIFSLCAAALFVFLFNIPIPVKKYAFGIRWGFLSTLYPIGGHPQIDKWLDEKKYPRGI